jgi:hypothetical protein
MRICLDERLSPCAIFLAAFTEPDHYKSDRLPVCVSATEAAQQMTTPKALLPTIIRLRFFTASFQECGCLWNRKKV